MFFCESASFRNVSLEGLTFGALGKKLDNRFQGKAFTYRIGTTRRQGLLTQTACQLMVRPSRRVPFASEQ
jgi:hypothetical protein